MLYIKSLCAVYESKRTDYDLEKFPCPQIAPSSVNKLSEILPCNGFLCIKYGIDSRFLLIFNFVFGNFQTHTEAEKMV